MSFTDDIYGIMFVILKDNGYFERDIYEKKKIVDDSLKDYILLKLKELGMINFDEEVINNMSVEDMIKVLLMYIPENKKAMSPLEEDDTKKDIVAPFIFFLQNLMSELQGYSFVWKIEEKPCIRPKIEVNEDGLWDSLTTGRGTNTLKTFMFLYKMFHESFMNNKIAKKKLKNY